MNSEETPKRSAKRKANRQTGRKPTTGLVKAVGLDADAFSQLESAARKIRLSKTEYTSAAVRYFTERGLNPTEVSVLAEGVQLRAQLETNTLKIRRENADVGNRLITIIRGIEKEQYKFHQAQQGVLVTYLERIETNLLRYLVGVENRVLAPMLERVIRGMSEAHIGRVLTEILVLKFSTTPYSNEKLEASIANYDNVRNQDVVDEIHKLLAEVGKAAPQISELPPVVKATLAPKVTGSPAAPASGTATS